MTSDGALREYAGGAGTVLATSEGKTRSVPMLSIGTRRAKHLEPHFHVSNSLNRQVHLRDHSVGTRS